MHFNSLILQKIFTKPTYIDLSKTQLTGIEITSKHDILVLTKQLYMEVQR